jgi:uncharacterized membrane protein
MPIQQTQGGSSKIYLAPFYMLATTLVGLGDVLYLSYYQYLNLLPSCAIGGCEIVLSSAYSKFLSIPLSYFGLVFYTYMLCLVVLLAIEPTSRVLRIATLLYSAVGAALSAVFIFYIQLTLLHGICLYCAISAAVAAILFCLAVWHFISTKK